MIHDEQAREISVLKKMCDYLIDAILKQNPDALHEIIFNATDIKDFEIFFGVLQDIKKHIKPNKKIDKIELDKFIINAEKKQARSK
jgi:hypothetical protein